MVTLDEIAQALGSVLRLARFDRTGAAGFGRDLVACRRSFWAYVIGLPAILLLIGLQVLSAETGRPELLAATQSIAYGIEAAGFPLLLLPVLRRLGRAERWAWFVTAYNWFTLAQTLLLVTVICLANGLPEPALRILIIAVNVYGLVVEAFLAESVLEIGGLRAGAIVLLDVFFGLGVDRIADWISGGA
jgi:hypothetical protein